VLRGIGRRGQGDGSSIPGGLELVAALGWGRGGLRRMGKYAGGGGTWKGEEPPRGEG
jgi:hypothetical protein